MTCTRHSCGLDLIACRKSQLTQQLVVCFVFRLFVSSWRQRVRRWVHKIQDSRHGERRAALRSRQTPGWWCRQTESRRPECRPVCAVRVSTRFSETETSRSYVSVRVEYCLYGYNDVTNRVEFTVKDRPMNKFRMIERHYFKDKVLKTFDFDFGFCIPNSTNTCEHIYDFPHLSESQSTPEQTISIEIICVYCLCLFSQRNGGVSVWNTIRQFLFRWW